MTHFLRRLSTIVAGLAVALVGLPAAAEAAPPPALGIVVKMGATTNPLAALLGLLTHLPLALDPLSSSSTSGLFLLRPSDPAADVASLTRSLAASPGVQFAEPNMRDGLVSGLGLHAWPYGPPVALGADASAWTGQPAATELRLGTAHGLSTGRGITVAVLDTGVDAGHPALAGHVGQGYDFVDDDADTTDRATGADSDGNGVPDEAVGHGTAVAGTVELVAPAARVLPYRVLDSDGTGTTYAAARAIVAAADAGARILNLSFGTPDGAQSKALADAVSYAIGRGAVVVAAAGNTGGTGKTYPAALRGVLSVTALTASGTALAPFAARGPWVALAAPGQQIVAPMPGGRYSRWDGTSFASPLVAGQVALIRARLPLGLTVTVTNAIAGTASKVTGADVEYGSVDVVRSLNPTAGLLPPGGPSSLLPVLGLLGGR